MNIEYTIVKYKFYLSFSRIYIGTIHVSKTNIHFCYNSNIQAPDQIFSQYWASLSANIYTENIDSALCSWILYGIFSIDGFRTKPEDVHSVYPTSSATIRCCAQLFPFKISAKGADFRLDQNKGGNSRHSNDENGMICDFCWSFYVLSRYFL